MTKYIIFFFFCSVLTTFGQVKKIKIKKDVVVADSINIVGVWYAKVLNDVGTGTGRIWKFKADGAFIEKRGNDGASYYTPRPNGKYNFTGNVLDIFQSSGSTDQTFNMIYTVQKRKDFLLLTITNDSKDKGPGKQMKLTEKLN